MTARAAATSNSNLLARIARRLQREARRPFKPLLHALRDRQAPSIHRWMHESSVPMTLSNKSALIVAPHPDHEAVYRLVDAAIRQIDFSLDIFKYPIWLIWKGPYRWTRQPDDLKGASRLDVRGVQGRKNRAIAVYASQLPVLPAGFVDQF